jgi:hypothetical protein
LRLTHISDSAGYYVAKEFPVLKSNLVVTGLSGF